MQIQLIQLLQTIRSPLTDLFFIGLNFFDTDAFYFLLIPALWFGKSQKVGLRLFVVVLLFTFCIQELKTLFALPRPFHILPSLAVIKVPGYGFPSGGAAGSMLLAALLLTYGKGKYKVHAALSFVFLVSLSRVFLGVHFFTDILGGWAVALIIWGLFVRYASPLEKQLKRFSRPVLLVLGQLLPLCFWLISPTIGSSAFIAMGITLSLFFTGFSLPCPKSRSEAIVRGVLGSLLSLFLYFIGAYLLAPKNPLYSFVVSYATGFTIGITGAYLCRKLIIEKRNG